MLIVGIDLSGPGSPQHTAVALCRSRRDRLDVQSVRVGATDQDILALVPDTDCVVGIDSPLSYSPSGGSRPGDIRARSAAIAAGLHPGAVMAPTAPRMAYLTLRGLGLSRVLERERPKCRIVEVHPTLNLALRGAPIAAVRSLKTSRASARKLVAWLGTAGVHGIPVDTSGSDHAIAACSGALAAWHWLRGTAVWRHEADPPVHPYDFTC